ncbi:2-phosphosulfolactate phosphatase family protein [Tumidithrix helvetica]|uniref:2-phosphosulfolactate phosphatase family protein n=1 Tax=Tumidithrix helvetica TaxID=3457545 RepID=UPI003CC5891A
MKLSVFHTPELTPEGVLPDCAIAVDVLRATTTIATALAAGAEAVQVFADLDALIRTSELHPAELRLRSAERGGGTVEGFDLGNSPFDYTADVVKGKRIFMSTTNGTRSLQRVQDAPVVLACAMINLGSVVSYLKQAKPETIWVVGSGWEGSYSLEDTACAGAIAAGLESDCEWANDEAIAALTLYQTWRDRLEELFCQASHGRRLLRLNCAADIAYCAKLDLLQVLPKQTAPGVLMA